MMADVKGGRGVTGISFSGKGNLEKPARKNETNIGKTTTANPIGRRYLGMLGPFKPKQVPRTFVPAAVKPKPLVAAAPAAKPPVKKAPAVISNVVREKPTPAQAAAPARKAVSARTGDTTGITTGKTTGTTARVGGVATKTSQSAYGRQMANAARRGNQPAGPMGGGGRSGSGGSSRPSGGGGNLGGARGRIGEPSGSKR